MNRPVFGLAGLILVGAALAGCQNDNSYRRRPPPDPLASSQAAPTGNTWQNGGTTNPSPTGTPPSMASTTPNNSTGMPAAPGMTSDTSAGLSAVTGRPTMPATAVGGAPTYSNGTYGASTSGGYNNPYGSGNPTSLTSNPGASPVPTFGGMPSGVGSPAPGGASADPGAFPPAPGMGAPNTARKLDDMNRSQQWDQMRTTTNPGYPAPGGNSYPAAVQTRQPGDLPE